MVMGQRWTEVEEGWRGEDWREEKKRNEKKKSWWRRINCRWPEGEAK